MPAPFSLADQEIIALIRADNRAAFNELYNRHWQSLYQMAWNVLKDEEICAEALQEVFVRLWENRSHLQINSLPAYLRAAVKYKVIDVLRKNRDTEKWFVKLEDLDAGHFWFDEDPLELKELKSLIAEQVAGLPERARVIFELSRNEQLSNREIAIKLGISEKTVENQITIAIRKLRSKMKGQFLWLFFL